MSYSGKAGVQGIREWRSITDRLLPVCDLLLKIEGSGIRRIRLQHVAEDVTRLGEPACFDEAARERDAKVVRIHRGDAGAKESDRRVGVAELQSRLGGEGVVARDRREQRDRALLALDRSGVVPEVVPPARDAIHGVPGLP